MCAYGGLDRVGSRICTIKRARRNKGNFCPAGQTSCARASQFEKLDNQGNTQYVADVDHTQRDFNSIVFNTFIFLQARTPALHAYRCLRLWDERNVAGEVALHGGRGFSLHQSNEPRQGRVLRLPLLHGRGRCKVLVAMTQQAHLTSYTDRSGVQIFNQFNARKIKDEYNIFAGIWQSQMFIYVAAIILAFQVRTSKTVPVLLCIAI